MFLVRQNAPGKLLLPKTIENGAEKKHPTAEVRNQQLKIMDIFTQCLLSVWQQDPGVNSVKKIIEGIQSHYEENNNFIARCDDNLLGIIFVGNDAHEFNVIDNEVLTSLKSDPEFIRMLDEVYSCALKLDSSVSLFGPAAGLIKKDDAKPIEGGEEKQEDVADFPGSDEAQVNADVAKILGSDAKILLQFKPTSASKKLIEEFITLGASKDVINNLSQIFTKSELEYYNKAVEDNPDYFFVLVSYDLRKKLRLQ